MSDKPKSTPKQTRDLLKDALDVIDAQNATVQLLQTGLFIGKDALILSQVTRFHTARLQAAQKTAQSLQSQLETEINGMGEEKKNESAA